MISFRIRQRLLGIFVVFFVTACGQNISDEEYLQRAQNYVAESDFNSASIELKNAIRQNSGNMTARLMLGQVYFEMGDLESSEKELIRVRDSASSPDRDTLVPLLAKVQLSLGKHDQVLDLKMDNLKPASLATILAAQSRSYMARSELALASLKVGQALELSPDSVYALNAKARLLYYQRKFAEADDLLSNIHAVDPGDVVSWGLHGDVKRSMGDVSAANEYYSRAIELDPSSLGYLMKRAFGRVQAQQLVLAQQDVDILMEIAPQSTQVNYAQGLISFFNQDYEKAISAFVVAEPDKFSFPQMLMYLGLAHHKNGNLDQAYIYAQDFYALVTDHPVGNKLLASLWIVNGKYVEAEQLIRTVLSRHPQDIEALNILANALTKQQRVDEAVDILAEVVELEPGSAQARVRLSVGYVKTGRKEEAIELIQDTIDLDPDFGQADVVLVLTYLRDKDFESALEAADDYQQRDPASVMPHLLIGRIYREAGDAEAARKAFLSAIELEPGNPSANHSLAIMAFRGKELDKARGYYKAVLKEHEHFLNTLIALAALEASLKNYEVMVDYLQEAIETHPQAIQPKVVLARYYLASERSDKVGLALSGLSDSQRDTPIILRLSAQYQFEEAKFSDARHSIERVIELGHGNTDDHLMLAAIHQQLGNEEKIRPQLDKALTMSPDSIEGHLAMATYAFGQADTQLLEKHLAVLEKLSPDSPELKQIQAAYARVSGDQEQALELFQQIYKSSPTTGSMLNLQKQYRLSGNQNAARQLLQSWVTEHTGDNMARMVLADSYLASGDQKLVLEEYGAILVADEENVIALNNMAMSLKEDKPELALEYAERASAIASGSPTVLDTLARVQSANGLHKEAWDTIQEALKIDDDNPGFIYHSAIIANEGGEPGKALKILQSLLREGGTFSQRDEAVELMESLSLNN